MITAKAQETAAVRNVIYVYGVAQAPRGQQPVAPQCEGLFPDSPVYPLVRGDFLAFVSAVPADRFGAEEFRAALKDTEWLKERILSHEKVLEQLRSRYDVLPFRFGTVYRDEAELSNALARHHDALCRAIERIKGASEWGVKLYCDADVLRRRIEFESFTMRQLHSLLEQVSPGARFFLQKKYAKTLDGEAAAAVARCVGRERESLHVCACESTEIAVQPPALHGRTSAMVLNGVYLVLEGSLPQFRRTLAALQDELADSGFDHELTGPWPPYHFVSIEQEGMAGAAASDR